MRFTSVLRMVFVIYASVKKISQFEYVHVVSCALKWQYIENLSCRQKVFLLYSFTPSIIKSVPNMINPFSYTIITLCTHTLRIRNAAERPIVYLNKCDYKPRRWTDIR